MLLTFKFLEHVFHRNFDQQQHNVLFLALKYEMNSNIIIFFSFCYFTKTSPEANCGNNE